VDDDLRALIEPLLPPWPQKSAGPQPVAERLSLQGILHVLNNDIAWQLLPLENLAASTARCSSNALMPDQRITERKATS
jgi:transposase